MGRHAMLKIALRVLAATFLLSAAITPSAAAAPAAAEDETTAPCGPVVEYRAIDWWRTTTIPQIARSVAAKASSERWQWRNDVNTLWRGDTRETVEEIFRTGFTPRGDQLTPLAEYIVKGGGQLSAHLSTSCDVSVAKRFATYGAEQTGWVYEIYAPGGIDVNATARVNNYQSPYLWNKEIDFPGGVEGNFIKGACKYRLTGTDPVTNEKTWEQLGCKDNAGFAPYKSEPTTYTLAR
ncbi:scabin-related ADP-ribosyltransferase [Streptomyces erythrochromogenes]|uniref:scabin-related ADP-ribosyltransferase n=1 Tax=Streptomyces erythrochromogenes TaxID=285574 RepID=UPI00380A13CB